MKKLLLFVMAVSLGLFVSAQGFGLGAKFGPGFSNVHGSATKDGDGNKFNKTLVTSHFGVFANYNFGGPISAQVEINYAGKGYKVKSDVIGAVYTYNSRINYLEIPILAQYTFGADWPVQVYGELGPFVGIKTGVAWGGSSYFGGYNNFNDYVKTIDFGVVIGAGGVYKVLDFLGVLVDLRYTLGLVNIQDYPSGHTGDKDALKTGVFNIDFGAIYYLGK